MRLIVQPNDEDEDDDYFLINKGQKKEGKE
jgi:hypothetical protein